MPATSETITDTHLDSLFHQFEAARGLQIEKATSALVDYAMRDHDDWSVVLQVVDKAYETILKGRDRAKQGEQLLNGIEAYLQESKIIFKFLYTRDSDPSGIPSGHPQIRGLLEKIQFKVNKVRNFIISIHPKAFFFRRQHKQ